MLEMPKIPTDNLYKFVAVACLLILLASGYAFTTILENDFAEVKVLMTDAAEDLRQAADAARERARTLDAMVAKAKGLPPTELAALYDEAKEIAERSVRTAAESETVRSRYRVAQMVVYVGAALVAGWYMWWAFRNWYLKVQKPLDEMIAAGELPSDPPR